MPIPHLNPSHRWQEDLRKEIKKKRWLYQKKQLLSDIKKSDRKKTGWVFFLLTLPFKIIYRHWRFFLALMLLGAFCLIGLFAWYSKELPDPKKLTDRAIAQSTKIFDRTGEHLLYEIYGEEQRTLIPLNQIPSYAVQATIALEDKNFYQHGGISFLGIVRGLILTTIKGQRAQGGSTLTQQLVKNAILTDERSIKRKVKEIILAYQIERKYSKDEILQMYFNEIPYGGTAYGLEAASNLYLGKSAKDLTLAEGAILAALPQRPSYLSPYGSHLDELFNRQQYALDQMVKLGYITAEQAQNAKAEKINFKAKFDGVEAPHFVFFIKELLSEKYGEMMIEQGGLKIISSLDYNLQKEAEKIIQEQAEKNTKDYDATNAALVSLDVKTGQILAMVGSKNFFDEEIDGQVNVALAPRQPGSSFKPIVYATAFSRGFVPETVVYDLDTVFPVVNQPDYTPHDYDLKQRGPVSLRKALAGSLNIPAVKMIYLAGIDNVLNLAGDLEYTTLTDRSRFGLSLVLGGGEVKLLEHVNAFAAFARDGRIMKYSPILKIEDPDGKIIEEYQNQPTKKVLETTVARMVNDILSDNEARSYIFGASNYLTLPDRPVAAKTGTTNDYHDAWTLGYTPQIATGVWVGNSNNDAMKRGADGSIVAAPIWNKFMRAAVKNLPVENFIKPEYSLPDKQMINGQASGVKVKIDKMSGLLATAFTPAHLIEERIFQQPHCLLYYVNKDNPLGPAPSNPADDPYYTFWEETVQKWAASQGIVNQPLPESYDNIHLVQDQFTLEISSPQENQTITSNLLESNFSLNNKKPIIKVEYYFDNVLFATNAQYPYNQAVAVPITLLNGVHNLKLKAFDEVENTAEDSFNINLDRQAYLNINWLNPSAPTTLNPVDFPFTLTISFDDVSNVKKIDFYYRLEQESSSSWLGFVENITGNTISYLWQSYPATGVYKIYPMVTDVGNRLIKGPETTISIE